jgi:hypothetical protein
MDEDDEDVSTAPATVLDLTVAIDDQDHRLPSTKVLLSLRDSRE